MRSSNLVPMNSYLRRLRGDSGLLPSVGRLGLIQLEADETLEIDSEDMVSAFNLFRMPAPWRGAFTNAKQVPASVCPGGDPNTMVYLAITTVPMGWVGAVDVTQHVARNIVFKLARVPSTTEVRPRGLFPDHGPYSLVCETRAEKGTCACPQHSASPGDPSVDGHAIATLREADHVCGWLSPPTFRFV